MKESLFCDIALAARIERVEAGLIAQSSAAARRRRADGIGFATPIAGGIASFAEPDSPLNKVAGLGFAGVPTPTELDAIERAFAACGAPVQVEVACLADPAIGDLFTGRGYSAGPGGDVRRHVAAELAGSARSVRGPWRVGLLAGCGRPAGRTHRRRRRRTPAG